MNSRECMFCGEHLTRENRAKEHIFPRWIQEHLSIADVEITPTHLSGSRESPSRVLSTRRHTLSNLLAGQVCARCNNGWMSNLETEATPILVDLMATNREVHTLSEAEREIVARWAAKTAFVLNRGSNYHQLIYRELAHSLRLNAGLPARVVVVGQHHDDLACKFFWMQSQSWIVRAEMDESEARDLQQGTFKIALQFGRLVLLVAYWPHEEWSYIYEKGLHVPLFPIRGPVLWTEGADFPWRDAPTALVHFSMLLGVGPKPASN